MSEGVVFADGECPDVRWLEGFLGALFFRHIFLYLNGGSKLIISWRCRIYIKGQTTLSNSKRHNM